MTIPEPSYISVAEVKANSLITGLTNLDEPAVTKLIQRAEAQIDKYVGRQQHHPDDENTDRVFPRLDDDDCGTPIIPLDVSQACLAQVEHLFSKWWPVSSTTQPKAKKDVKSETIGGDGSYSATYAADGMARPDDFICDQAKGFLAGYVNRFVGISVPDPDAIPSPT